MVSRNINLKVTWEKPTLFKRAHFTIIQTFISVTIYSLKLSLRTVLSNVTNYFIQKFCSTVNSHQSRLAREVDAFIESPQKSYQFLLLPDLVENSPFIAGPAPVVLKAKFLIPFILALPNRTFCSDKHFISVLSNTAATNHMCLLSM